MQHYGSGLLELDSWSSDVSLTGTGDTWISSVNVVTGRLNGGGSLFVDGGTSTGVRVRAPRQPLAHPTPPHGQPAGPPARAEELPPAYRGRLDRIASALTPADALTATLLRPTGDQGQPRKGRADGRRPPGSTRRLPGACGAGVHGLLEALRGPARRRAGAALLLMPPMLLRRPLSPTRRACGGGSSLRQRRWSSGGNNLVVDPRLNRNYTARLQLLVAIRCLLSAARRSCRPSAAACWLGD